MYLHAVLYLQHVPRKVELNKSYDFNKITEAGAKLRPLSGPGFTGIKNLGNSCYMNSCLQVSSVLFECDLFRQPRCR